MTKENLRIIFMGTPQFAVESLKALIQGGYKVVGVVTMPDKPSGRGHRMQQSPVKEFALENKLPVLQPSNLKDEAFLTELSNLKADLQVVVAFRMLPEVVWDMPPFGTFNLHASLLPQYRGAAPINWAVINGEQETGATTFFLKHEIDTGEIALQHKIKIEADDNAGIIHDKLMIDGAKLVTDTIDLIISDELKTIPQNKLYNSESELKSAPKIFPETCQLDTSISTEAAHNFVRGLSPYPAARLKVAINGEDLNLKVFRTSAETAAHNHQPGSLIIESKKGAKLALRDGYLHLEEIQAPGKRRMPILDFLNGLKIMS